MDKASHSKYHPSSTLTRLFFFWAGIIATFAYRIIVFIHESPFWVETFWYIGTVGFVLYFWHRANVQKKRAEIVRDNKLVEAIDSVDSIGSKQKEALHYILETTMTSKARFNSLFIFWLSLAALIAGILVDLGLFKF